MENADSIRTAIAGISVRLVALDSLEVLEPADCQSHQVIPVVARIDARLALLGDNAVTTIGDGVAGPELAAAFDTISARLTVLEEGGGDTYAPTGLGAYVGDLFWSDDALGHVYAHIVASDLASTSGSLGAGGDFFMAALTSVVLPALTTVGSALVFGGDTLSTLTLPALATVGNAVTIATPALASVDLSALATVGEGIDISLLAAASMTALDLSSLTSVGADLIIELMPALTSLDLASLSSVGGSIHFGGLDGLTSLSLPSLTAVGGNVIIPAALSQASVDGILVKLASLNGTGGTTSYDGLTIDLSGGTNAAPGATGRSAIAILESTDRANTVTTN